MEDETAERGCRTLWSGFIIYFADNVLVMLLATTAGTLGQNLFTGLEHPMDYGLGILFNVGLCLVFYLQAAYAFHRYADASDSEDEEKSSLTPRESSRGIELTSLAKAGLSHRLAMLPWIIIVPMVNVPVYVSEYIHTQYKSEPYSGKLFVAHFAMFAIYLCIAIVLARVYANRPDSGAKCEGLATFLLNSVNHAMLSSAGKSLHLIELVVYSAIVGKEYADASYQSATKLREKSVETIMGVITTYFLLSYVWPRLQETTQADKLTKSIVTTITVYTWAFSFINHIWSFFYYDVPHGQAIYWGVMGACCLVALVLAYFSELNFYGGPSWEGKAFGLMLCWVVDFGVWWEWGNVMTVIDETAAPDGSFTQLLLTNGLILLGFIIVTTVIYMFGDLEAMEAQAAQRTHHSHHYTQNHHKVLDEE